MWKYERTRVEKTAGWIERPRVNAPSTGGSRHYTGNFLPAAYRFVPTAIKERRSMYDIRSNRTPDSRSGWSRHREHRRQLLCSMTTHLAPTWRASHVHLRSPSRVWSSSFRKSPPCFASSREPWLVGLLAACQTTSRVVRKGKRTAVGPRVDHRGVGRSTSSRVVWSTKQL